MIANEGPLNAKLVLIGGSPLEEDVEAGRPFVGRVGRVLDSLLQRAGISRADCRLIYCVPERAPGDKFAAHSAENKAKGRALFEVEIAMARKSGALLFMPLGNDALEWLCPTLPYPPRWSGDEPEEDRGRITAWRGSLFPLDAPPTNVLTFEAALRPQVGPYVLPTYDPQAINKQFQWHPWGVLDFQKASQFLAGKWEWPRQRKWFTNDYGQLDRFAHDILIGRRVVEGRPQGEHCVAIDTEMSPYPICALVSEWEVHTFEWDERARPALTAILESPWILKIAHNLGHDATWCREAWDIEMKWPAVDTSGLAHNLDSSLARNLSPALATRFTTLPYWKWMVAEDPKRYCGYDTIGAYDGYWKAVQQIGERGLLPVANHDHRLLQNLLPMQWRGVKIDEPARMEALTSVKRSLALVKWQWRGEARKVVREKWQKFNKPHLFRIEVQCSCCGGGKLQREHCWRCGGLPNQPKKKEDYAGIQLAPAEPARASGSQKTRGPTVIQLRSALPRCLACSSTGKVVRWLPLHGEKKASTFQIADVLYRGFGIPPRKWKGEETTRADQLSPLRDEHKAVDLVCQMADLAAQQTTMDRLSPDFKTGRTHPTFDPWGTASGRVASREGLIQRGTNIQNLEKDYRNILVADDGFLLVAPDKAQVEGRTLCAASGDPVMRRMYFEEPVNWPGHPKHGQIDAHTKVAQIYLQLVGKAISRDQAKRQTFAMFYGARPEQLAIELNSEYERKGKGCRVSSLDVARVLDYLWRLFTGVKRYQDSLFAEVARTRRCTSPTGRVRTWNGYIYDKKAKGLTYEIQKEVRSFPPQDMAAWVLADDLDAIVTRGAGLITPLIHVHDELVVQIPEEPTLRDKACVLIKECMTRTLWGMEFPVDNIAPAKTWRAAKGGE